MSARNAVGQGYAVASRVTATRREHRVETKPIATSGNKPGFILREFSAHGGPDALEVEHTGGGRRARTFGGLHKAQTRRQ